MGLIKLALQLAKPKSEIITKPTITTETFEDRILRIKTELSIEAVDFYYLYTLPIQIVEVGDEIILRDYKFFIPQSLETCDDTYLKYMYYKAVLLSALGLKVKARIHKSQINIRPILSNYNYISNNIKVFQKVSAELDLITELRGNIIQSDFIMKNATKDKLIIYLFRQQVFYKLLHKFGLQLVDAYIASSYCTMSSYLKNKIISYIGTNLDYSKFLYRNEIRIAELINITAILETLSFDVVNKTYTNAHHKYFKSYSKQTYNNITFCITDTMLQSLVTKGDGLVYSSNTSSDLSEQVLSVELTSDDFEDCMLKAEALLGKINNQDTSQVVFDYILRKLEALDKNDLTKIREKIFDCNDNVFELAIAINNCLPNNQLPLDTISKLLRKGGYEDAVV